MKKDNSIRIFSTWVFTLLFVGMTLFFLSISLSSCGDSKYTTHQHRNYKKEWQRDKKHVEGCLKHNPVHKRGHVHPYDDLPKRKY